MQIKHLKSLFTFKKIALFGSGLGIMFILFGRFGSDFNSFFFTALGFGVLLGSVVNYLFGTFISLMEEFTTKSKEEPKFAWSTNSYYYH